jgi:dihydrofolate reductase
MIFRDYTDTLPAPALQALGLHADCSVFDTVVMGRKTYDVAFDAGLDNPYPHLRQYVFSRSTKPVGDAVTLSESPVRTVRSLKAEPEGSGIWLCGGGKLASALYDEIDRLVLKVNPIVLGSGLPLFDGPADPNAFTLTASTRYQSGVIVNEYARI